MSDKFPQIVQITKDLKDGMANVKARGLSEDEEIAFSQGASEVFLTRNNKIRVYGLRKDIASVDHKDGPTRTLTYFLNKD